LTPQSRSPSPGRSGIWRLMTRLADDQVGALRERAAAGVPVPQLAAEFGVSRAYCYKLVAGEARAGAVSPADDESGGVAATVREFVAGLGGLSGRHAAVAGLAVDLARRLDSCPPGTAAGAAAAARVAAMLSDLLGELAPADQDATAAATRLLRGLMRP